MKRILAGVLLAAGVVVGGWLWVRDSSLVAVRDVYVTGVSSSEGPQIRSALRNAALEDHEHAGAAQPLPEDARALREELLLVPMSHLFDLRSRQVGEEREPRKDLGPRSRPGGTRRRCSATCRA